MAKKRNKATKNNKPSSNVSKVGWHEKLNSTAKSFKIFSEGIKELAKALVIASPIIGAGTAISSPDRTNEIFEGISKALEGNFPAVKEKTKLEKSLTKKST